MSTADKLMEIANNVPQVFAAGYVCFRDNIDDLKNNTTLTDLSSYSDVDISKYGGQASISHFGYYNFGEDPNNFGEGEGTIYTSDELQIGKYVRITAYGNGNVGNLSFNGKSIDISKSEKTPYEYIGDLTTPIYLYYSFGACDIRVSETILNTLPSATDLYDRYWDDFQNEGRRTDYTGLGANNIANPHSFGGWQSQKIVPKYPLKPIKAYGMFAHCSKIVEAPEVDLSIADSVESMFFDCEKLCRVGDLFLKCNRFEYAFLSCPSLKRVGTITAPNAISMQKTFLGCSALEIVTEIDAPNVTNWYQVFARCESLKKVTFVHPIIADIDLHWSSQLTTECLNSVIKRLSDTTTGKTITLPIAAIGRISDELLLSKNNWTISYL